MGSTTPTTSSASRPSPSIPAPPRLCPGPTTPHDGCQIHAVLASTAWREERELTGTPSSRIPRRTRQHGVERRERAHWDVVVPKSTPYSPARRGEKRESSLRAVSWPLETRAGPFSPTRDFRQLGGTFSLPFLAPPGELYFAGVSPRDAFSSLFKLLFKESTKRPRTDPAGLTARAALALF